MYWVGLECKGGNMRTPAFLKHNKVPRPKLIVSYKAEERVYDMVIMGRFYLFM
jgi:hypothetical protein